MDQHEKTLSAASEFMKKELSERDVRTAQETFYANNPEFNTPEMQARIKAYIAKDRTGMTDPLVAFREIQRDDIAAKATALEAENTEYKRLIDLEKGKDKTGKVVTKNGGSGSQGTPHQKVIGQALDD
jgi:hypothetical protein